MSKTGGKLSVKMFPQLGKNRKEFKNLKNIISLGSPIKNVQNTKMQFKKTCHSQIDEISA